MFFRNRAFEGNFARPLGACGSFKLPTIGALNVGGLTAPDRLAVLQGVAAGIIKGGRARSSSGKGGSAAR